MSYPFLSDVFKALLGHDIWMPIAVPMFGMMVAIAMLVGFWIFRKELLRLESSGRLPRGSEDGSIMPMSALTGEFATTTMIAAVVGARVFSILEDPAPFFQDPIRVLFARGGLAMFGGLIFGLVAAVFFLRRRHLPLRPVGDAMAPALMLSYAIGRMGCQISGDGDWGILANMQLKPDWLPQWLWAQTYTHNIMGQFIPEPGVYPTPVYEILMAAALFGVLWMLRKHKFQAGWLFSLYILMSGVERFFIEKIRVNVRYSVSGFQFTQAELISVILIGLGLAGMVYCFRSRQSVKVVKAATT